MINRIKDNSSLDPPSVLFSGSYVVDSDSGFNNNNNKHNLRFVNEFKVNPSVNGSQNSVVNMEHVSYPHYIPNMDYMQCFQTTEKNFESFCSPESKLSYSFTQEHLQPVSFSQSSEQDIDLYLSNTEKFMKVNEVDENDNSINPKCRQGKGRDIDVYNGTRKRHLNRDNSVNSKNGTSNSKWSIQGRGKHGKALARHPFIPSYMDPNNGPHLCVVCRHNASGFHYRVMACEGCKGFFRRTVQNNLSYSCKFNKKCEIQPHNRAQCQECRWRKCLEVGMAKDLVLNDEARRAKKDLIAANRAKKLSTDKSSSKGSNDLKDPTSPVNYDTNNFKISEEDERLISQIKMAFDETDVTNPEVSSDFQDQNMVQILQSVVNHHVTSLIVKCDVVDERSIEAAKFNFQDEFNTLAMIVGPMLQRVISFAFLLPKFQELSTSDQIILLKSTCFDIICLRNTINYNKKSQVLQLGNDYAVSKDLLKLCKLLEPTYMFVKRIAALNMDPVEVSLMAALGLLSCDRLGLQDIDTIEGLQDDILRLTDFYMKQNGHENTHRQSELYATILPELRSTSTWHIEIMSSSTDSIICNLLPTIKAIYRYQDIQLCSPFSDSSNSRFSMTPSSQLIATTNRDDSKLFMNQSCQIFDSDLKYPSFPYTSRSMPSFYPDQDHSLSLMLGNVYTDSLLPSLHLGRPSGRSSFTELLIEPSPTETAISGLLVPDTYTTQGSSSSSYANYTPVTNQSESNHDTPDPVFDFTNGSI